MLNIIRLNIIFIKPYHSHLVYYNHYLNGNFVRLKKFVLPFVINPESLVQDLILLTLKSLIQLLLDTSFNLYCNFQ